MNELEQKVRSLLNADSENGSLSVLQVLEHIDDIERLGLGYRFQNDIIRALSTIADRNIVKIGEKEDSVYAASLKFRLLRKHGYNVSQGTSNFLLYIHQDFHLKSYRFPSLVINFFVIDAL